LAVIVVTAVATWQDHHAVERQQQQSTSSRSIGRIAMTEAATKTRRNNQLVANKQQQWEVATAVVLETLRHNKQHKAMPATASSGSSIGKDAMTAIAKQKLFKKK